MTSTLGFVGRIAASVNAHRTALKILFLEPVQKLRGAAQEQVREGDVDDGFSGGMEEFVVLGEPA